MAPGGRFFLLPEDEKFHWQSKDVIYPYDMRYIANLSFAPWQDPGSNGVKVYPDHAPYIPAITHVGKSENLISMCKNGVTPGGQGMQQYDEDGDTRGEARATTGSNDAQWTFHDPRDKRQMVHGRDIRDHDMIISLNVDMLLLGSQDVKVPPWDVRMTAAGFIVTRMGPAGTAFANLGVTPEYWRIVEIKLPGNLDPRRPEACIFHPRRATAGVLDIWVPFFTKNIFAGF